MSLGLQLPLLVTLQRTTTRTYAGILIALGLVIK